MAWIQHKQRENDTSSQLLAQIMNVLSSLRKCCSKSSPQEVILNFGPWHGIGTLTLLDFKIEYEILFYEIIRLKAKSKQGEPTSAAILQ